ncbi:MAG TPA: nitroreductase family protein, partial [Candidatus Nanoarchaeia archaeon]|nr:nitroreductase family protein [Candidatus Nanoarchaeia archaeon]
IVVVCTDPSLAKNAYEERGEKYTRQQAGAAIENFLLKIEEKGLETCWVGYFVDYLIKEALHIPTEINVEAIFPIGVESKKPGTTIRKKQKIELDRILYFNKWKNKRMKEKDSMDV